jgi:hypothetical protein
MRKSIRVTTAAAATIAAAVTMTATGSSAGAATPSAATFCTTAPNYSVPLGSLGILNLGGLLFSGPARYTTLTVCYAGKPVQAQVIVVTSLASGYIAIDIPPQAPVTIPIPLPL